MPWEKGKSGNPAGAVRRKLITTRIEMELMKQATDSAVNEDVNKAQRIAEKVVEMALGGSPWAIEFVTVRTEGAPEQTINIRKNAQEMSDSDLTDIAAGSRDRALEAPSGPQVPPSVH